MIGKNISHYKILEKLGEGGMGVVYKAQDTKLDRIVALKFLPKHLLCNSEAKERFEQEAKAASALDHPNIATIFEIDEAEGECFISMAYIEGKSIKELLKEKSFTIEEILNIAIQMGEGLNTAHRKGIVHRDIKSDNLMLTNDGLVKIMDFGLAKLRGVSKLTKTGSTLGTVAYMSPEQARGEEVDARTDVWSLGVVMYEMITGQLPFKGEYEQALIYSILHEEPQSVISLRADTPLQLERIVRKILEKDKSKRYQSVQDIIPDLKQATALGIQLPKQEKSIVVLPFENLSPDPDQEYFSDGLTEEVISDLSKVHALRVISRSSAMTFKGTRKKVPEIARELDVQYVLEGSVRKVGNSLRIAAQLIDAESDAHIWAEKYSGTLDDVFDVQEKVSRSIVDALKLRLTPEEKQRMAERPIDNVAAYECYLRANHEIWRFREDSLDRAVQNLQNGIDIIGDNALLYSGMAWAYWQYVNIGAKQEDYLARAKDYAKKALAMDPNFSKANVVLGYIYEFVNQQEGIRYFKKALAINPNEPHALRRLAVIYSSDVGKPSAALPLIERYKKADPLNPDNYSLQGYSYFFDGQFGLALDQFRKWYQSDPENPAKEFFYALTLAYNNALNEVFSIIEKCAEADPNNVLSKFGLLLKYGLLKDREKAFQIMTPDFRKTCQRDGEWSYYVAEALALLDEKKEALDWLENAVNRGVINYPFINEYDSFLANLRGEERFRKLMERVKYEWEHFEV
jgi:serine/threonine protein kinase/lipoprotein NlpI